MLVCYLVHKNNINYTYICKTLSCKARDNPPSYGTWYSITPHMVSKGINLLIRRIHDINLNSSMYYLKYCTTRKHMKSTTSWRIEKWLMNKNVINEASHPLQQACNHFSGWNYVTRYLQANRGEHKWSKITSNVRNIVLHWNIQNIETLLQWNIVLHNVTLFRAEKIDKSFLYQMMFIWKMFSEKKF